MQKCHIDLTYTHLHPTILADKEYRYPITAWSYWIWRRNLIRFFSPKIRLERKKYNICKKVVIGEL